MKKQILSAFTAAALLLGSAPTVISSAVTETCTTYSGSNTGAQNYTNYGSTINSYLVKTSDGRLMRVQNVSSSDGLIAEYYDTDYNLLETKTIPAQLSIFGGFYESDTNYFVVTGQKNPDEDDTLACYRITKYDKSWNEIKSVDFSACNTWEPFDAGSCRMETLGDYLLVHTCHEMYESSDGYHHQSNYTLEINMNTMEAVSSSVTDPTFAYSSHSFNQFIKTDGDSTVVTVDHGDAYPRSIRLRISSGDKSTGAVKALGAWVNGTYVSEVVDIMEFPGDVGNNVTGASVGGFEVSDSSYLVAGNSVVQDSGNTSYKTRNVFVASVDKSTRDVNINWITDFAEGETTASTPQFVELATDDYMLLWTRGSNVYYTEIDGSGNKISDIYSFEGNLSDCVPVVSDGKVIWYTWKNENVTFYDISVSDFSKTNVTPIQNGHVYVNLGVTDGVASLECSRCGETLSKNVITNMSLYWNTTGTYGSYGGLSNTYYVGDTLYFWAYNTQSDADQEIEVIYPDDGSLNCVKSSDTMGCFEIIKPGTFEVTFRPKYNPEYSKTYTINAKFSIESTSVKLENDISEKFYVSKQIDKYYSNPYVIVDQDKADGTVKSTKIEPEESGENYVFEYTGLNAKEVGDDLHITLYATDSDGNTVKGETVDYSVKDYCMNLLDNYYVLYNSGYDTDEKLAAVRQLLADLLNYSSEAQEYFGYGTDSLANSEMNDTVRGYATSDSADLTVTDISNPEYAAVDNPTAEWDSAGLNLLNTVNIRVVFKYDGDISGVTLKAKLDGGTETEIKEFTDLGDGYYYALYDGVNASQFASPVDFTLYENGTAISNTLRYSVESYIARMGDRAELSDLLTALLKYGRSAVNYNTVMA